MDVALNHTHQRNVYAQLTDDRVVATSVSKYFENRIQFSDWLRSVRVVKIWFTEKLEPALSKIQVFDSSGQEIDKRDVKIDQSNAVLLALHYPATSTSASVSASTSASIFCNSMTAVRSGS